MASTNELGAAAEEYVASLYRSLGFIVTRDTLLGGNQVDLLVSRAVAGFEELRLAVEVKHRTSKPVGKEEVLLFANVIRPLLQAGKLTGGVIVASDGFTRFARSAAEEVPGLSLKSLSDLENELLLVHPALIRRFNSYRDGRVADRFIDLSLHLLDTEGAEPTVPRRLATSALLELAEGVADLALVVFADYGGGKTTTLERISAKAAERFVTKKSELVPILFLLREFLDVNDIDAFVVQTVQRELDVVMSVDQFWSFVDGGRLLLLLDGFDEITLRAGPEKRMALLQQLSPLLYGASPAILTSRPSYFVDAKEYKTALRQLRRSAKTGREGLTPVQVRPIARQLRGTLRERYQTPGMRRTLEPRYAAYALDSVTSAQIDGYLQKFENQFLRKGFDSWQAVRKYIDSIYDLSDLITRPILLDMIVQTVLSDAVDPQVRTQKLGPAELYDIYTTLKLDNDWDKSASRRELLSSEERGEFAERAAWHMLETGHLELERSEFLVLADATVRRTDINEEEMLTDLRTCSFLTTTSRGRMRFIHKSFQEFFVARRLRDELLRMNAESIAARAISDEVCYFLGAYVVRDSQLRERIDDLIAGIRDRRRGLDAPSSALRALCTSVLYWTDELTDVKWPTVTIGRCRRPSLAVKNCSLLGLTVDDFDVDRLQLSRSKFRGRLTSRKALRLSVESSELMLTHVGPRLDLEAQASDVELTYHSTDKHLSKEGVLYTLLSSDGDVSVSAPHGRKSTIAVKGLASRMRISCFTGALSMSAQDTALFVDDSDSGGRSVDLVNSTALWQVRGQGDARISLVCSAMIVFGPHNQRADIVIRKLDSESSLLVCNPVLVLPPPVRLNANASAIVGARGVSSVEEGKYGTLSGVLFVDLNGKDRAVSEPCARQAGEDLILVTAPTEMMERLVFDYSDGLRRICGPILSEIDGSKARLKQMTSVNSGAAARDSLALMRSVLRKYEVSVPDRIWTRLFQLIPARRRRGPKAVDVRENA